MYRTAYSTGELLNTPQVNCASDVAVVVMDAGDSVVAWTTENDAEDDNGDDVTGTGADEDETASGSVAPIDAERSPSISNC